VTFKIAQFRNLIILLGMLAACVPPRPVPPTVPTSPLERYVRLTVRGTDGHAPPATVVTLTTDTPITMPCVLEGDRANCRLDASVPIGDAEHGIGGHLLITAPDYDELRRDVFLTGQNQELGDGPGQAHEFVLTPTYRPLPRLVRVGKFLRTEVNARFTGIGATDFDLLEKFIACRECIVPVLQQRSHPWGDERPGFNTLRVWTMFNVCPDGHCPPSNQRIGRLYPHEHPDFYDQARALARLAARYDLYLELTAFTGSFREYSEAQRIAHWEGLIGVAGDMPNVWLDLVNEWDHAAMQGFSWAPFREPPLPIIASRGSGQADSPPVLPVWRSLATYHPGFGEEWPRKAVHNGMEDVADPYNVPVWIDEMTRFPDGDSNPQHAYDVGRGCALMVAG
jgi:hypothetical protein